MSLNNIPEYSPAQYIDNSEPDINAANLNKTEQALKRVTAAANEAIAALRKLDSAKIDTSKIVNSLAATDTSSVLSGALGPVIDQRLTDLLNKYNQLNGETLKCGIGPVLTIPIDGSVLELSKTYMSYGSGMAFINVMERGDIPNDFDYASGILLYRSDTISVVLISRHRSSIAVNTWNVTKWTGWKTFIGVAV